MSNNATIIAFTKHEHRVKRMLTQEEQEVVNLIANAFVDNAIKKVYESKESNQVPADINRQAEQL